MKKIILLLILGTGFCAPKPKVTKEIVYGIPIALDRPRMEHVIRLLPSILVKSQQFQKQAQNVDLPDQEYNTRFYQFLFSEEDLAQDLKSSGFTDAESYQEFYDEMIEMYMLLFQQPEVLETAVSSIPAYEKEVNTLLLKKGQEPNNTKLSSKLNKLQYELFVYQNLVLVNSFVGQLNAFNKPSSQ